MNNERAIENDIYWIEHYLNMLEKYISDYSIYQEPSLSNYIKYVKDYLNDLALYEEISIDLLNDYSSKLFEYERKLDSYKWNYDEAHGNDHYAQFIKTSESSTIGQNVSNKDNNTKKYIGIAAAIIGAAVVITILFK